MLMPFGGIEMERAIYLAGSRLDDWSRPVPVRKGILGGSATFMGLFAVHGVARVDRGIKHSWKRDLWVPWRPPMGSMLEKLAC